MNDQPTLPYESSRPDGSSRPRGTPGLLLGVFAMIFGGPGMVYHAVVIARGSYLLATGQAPVSSTLTGWQVAVGVVGFGLMALQFAAGLNLFALHPRGRRLIVRFALAYSVWAIVQAAVFLTVILPGVPTVTQKDGQTVALAPQYLKSSRDSAVAWAVLALVWSAICGYSGTGQPAPAARAAGEGRDA